MKQMWRRLISCILSVMLLFSVVTTCAEEITDTESVQEENLTEEKTGIIGAPNLEHKEKTVFYVAPDGDNSNPGTIDKPFATIEGARDALRALKESNGIGPDGAVVYLRGGNYAISETISFDQRDSGTKDAPILYRNYPDEKVNFIGGASIEWSEFSKLTDESVLERIVDGSARSKIYVVDLFALGFTNIPEQPWPGPYSYPGSYPDAEHLAALQDKLGIKKPNSAAPALIINDKEMTLARYPNDKQLIITRVDNAGSYTEPTSPFKISFDDARVKYWTKAKDAIITGTPQYSWGTLSVTMGEVDPASLAISSKYPVFHKALVDQRVHIYNLLEEIDVPGEYFVDRETGKLYIYPETTNVKSVYYTMLNGYMFNIKSEYITLKGIDMMFMNNSAVVFSDSNNCKVIDCEITGTGKKAIGAWANCSEIQILDCNLYNNDGGIELTGGDRKTLTLANNLVENCKIGKSDRITTSYSPGIRITETGCLARHNEIYDSNHVIFMMSGNLHTVEFNEIHSACLDTDDMGAMYSGRALTHRGNVVRYNYFHDIGSVDVRGAHGTHAIYYDDFWSAANTVGNVFENITGFGVVTSGSYNVIHNNIFANCGGSMKLYRSYDYGTGANYNSTFQADIDSIPYKSEVWVSHFPEIVNVVSEDGTYDTSNYIVATNNVHYNSKPPQVEGAVAKTLTSVNNVVFQSDPGFYDLENRNYLLKSDSQVYEKIPEFEPIPFTRMGRYSERAINRVKNAYVFCMQSPYVMENGKVVNENKEVTKLINDDIYVPIRMAVDAIGGTISYDEETENIEVIANVKKLEFKSGEGNTAKLDGVDYSFVKPIVNIDHTNYISLSELADIFDIGIVYNGNIAVVSARKKLFNPESDKELLRYIEEQITVY